MARWPEDTSSLTNEQYDDLSDDEREWYHDGADFETQIECGMCGRIVAVGGAIWKSRLRASLLVQVEDEETGRLVMAHTGWNCDGCADALEGGWAP